jgi:hypothetical protein
MDGVSASLATPGHPCGARSGAAPDPGGHLEWPPPCRPGSRHRKCTAPSGVARWVRWLPEPVVGSAAAGGCSQRRWTPASRAVRRPRSRPRPEGIAGPPSERASAKPRPSPWSPVTSPSCQQPMTAWVTWSGSTPTLAQVSWSQRRSSPVRWATNPTSSVSRSGWPARQRIHQTALGRGTQGCSRAAGATSRMVPARVHRPSLAATGGRGRSLAPGRPRGLAVSVGGELGHWLAPAAGGSVATRLPGPRRRGRVSLQAQAGGRSRLGTVVADCSRSPPTAPAQS